METKFNNKKYFYNKLFFLQCCIVIFVDSIMYIFYLLFLYYLTRLFRNLLYKEQPNKKYFRHTLLNTEHIVLMVTVDSDMMYFMDRVYCVTININTLRLNLRLSSSSTTSRELLSQFSTCSGWKWFKVGEKLKKIAMCWKFSLWNPVFRHAKWCFSASWGLKGLTFL